MNVEIGNEAAQFLSVNIHKSDLVCSAACLGVPFPIFIQTSAGSESSCFKVGIGKALINTFNN
jgi:hypothetical protein